MKVSIYSNDQSAINTVYGKKQIDRIKNIAQIISFDEKENIDYLFSTWGMPKLDENQIKTDFPNLKGVFYSAGSVKDFAKEFLNCGIKIYSAWQANAVPVAEYTFAQIILALKGFFTVQHTHSYEDRNNRTGVFDAKIGICGAGAIGRLVANRLKTIDCEVYIFDKYLSEKEIEALGGKKASLEYIFENCDVISNHLANVPELINIFDYSLFSKMKPYSTFINTGRGAQVIETDLAKAMLEDSTKTALLDVTEPEPIEKDNPLGKLKNVIITPHIAGSLSNECKRMSEYMIDEFERVISNKPPLYEVTLSMLDTMA